MSADSPRFQASVIEGFLASAFAALDVPPEDAKAVAGLMVKADLYGYDTHGTFRLRQYVDRLRDGGTNPRARIKTAKQGHSTAVIDGGRSIKSEA